MNLYAELAKQEQEARDAIYDAAYRYAVNARTIERLQNENRDLAGEIDRVELRLKQIALTRRQYDAQVAIEQGAPAGVKGLTTKDLEEQ